MSQNKIYTGIGSRETPPEVQALMTRIGFRLAEYDWTLRSGHAPGADQAFEHGAIAAQGKMEIYLPWYGFENSDVLDGREGRFIVPRFTRELMSIAERFHPNWSACSVGAKKMHARNVCQVAGLDLNTASDMVICWTKDGKRGGGTGQALRIAEYLKIPIFDLAVCTQGQILNFVKYGVVP